MCMKKSSFRESTSKWISLVFIVGGLAIISIIGILLSDPGKKIWQEKPDAAAYCADYSSYPSGTCSNATCSVGRYCSRNSVAGATEVKCVSHAVSGDFIVDCCPAGQVLNNSKSACAVTTCSVYKDYSKYYCTNTDCPTGRFCHVGPLQGATNVKCTSHTTTVDQIMDCCGPGKVLNATETACVDPANPVSSALQNVYVTFGRFKYNRYVSPASLRTGDTAYIKNFDRTKIRLIQVFLYDYEKRGNQGYAKSNVTPSSMYLKTTSLLPTGKRYAYVFKFQDNASGTIATKYFVVYTATMWLGKSTL